MKFLLSVLCVASIATVGNSAIDREIRDPLVRSLVVDRSESLIEAENQLQNWELKIARMKEARDNAPLMTYRRVTLESAIGELEFRLYDARQFMSELEESSGDSRSKLQVRIQTKLDEIEQSYETVMAD